MFVFVENAAIEPEQAPEEHIEQADGERDSAPADEHADDIVDEKTGNAYRIDGLITCMIGSSGRRCGR